MLLLPFFKAMIFKVLKEDARTNYKFDTAKTYIHSRFTKSGAAIVTPAAAVLMSMIYTA